MDCVLTALLTGVMLFGPSPVHAFSPARVLQHRATAVRSPPLRAKTDGGNSFDARANAALLDELEARAIAAAESWGSDVTEFLEPGAVTAMVERLEGLADVACVVAGGRAGAARARLVLTRADLVEADADAADELAAEHTALLRVEADLRNSIPLPNALANIGIDLSDVGDVMYARGIEGVAYVVVAPPVAKQVVRLLGKELVGAPAVGVEQLAPRSAVPDGELQDMAVQRLDSREQKRREFYNKKR